MLSYLIPSHWNRHNQVLEIHILLFTKYFIAWREYFFSSSYVVVSQPSSHGPTLLFNSTHYIPPKANAPQVSYSTPSMSKLTPHFRSSLFFILLCNLSYIEATVNTSKGPEMYVYMKSTPRPWAKVQRRHKLYNVLIDTSSHLFMLSCESYHPQQQTNIHIQTSTNGVTYQAMTFSFTP